MGSVERQASPVDVFLVSARWRPSHSETHPSVLQVCHDCLAVTLRPRIGIPFRPWQTATIPFRREHTAPGIGRAGAFPGAFTCEL